MYAPNRRAPTYVKDTLLKLKSHIKPHTLAVGDVYTSLSPKDMSARQKLNREIKQLTYVMTQMGLSDIFRTFHPKTKACTFSESHGTFSKTEHISSNKVNHNRYKK